MINILNVNPFRLRHFSNLRTFPISQRSKYIAKYTTITNSEADHNSEVVDISSWFLVHDKRGTIKGD